MNTALDFLNSLAEAIGIPLAFGDELVCSVTTPDGLMIQIESAPDHGVVVLTAALGDVLPGDERLLRHLLAANFLFQGTRGESIGLEESTNRAMLCRQFDPTRTTPPDGVEIFRAFCDTATRWRGHLASAPVSASSETPAEALLRA